MEEKQEILKRELHLFEAAAARAAAGELDPGEESAGRIADEFLRRTTLRQAWAEEALSTISGPRPIRQPHRTRHLWLVLVVAEAYTVLTIYSGSAWLLVIGVFVALIVLSELAHRRWVRRALGVFEGACPHCEYPLRDIPDGIATEVIGVRVGPRRCPECGIPWPRVPGVNG